MTFFTVFVKEKHGDSLIVLYYYVCRVFVLHLYNVTIWSYRTPSVDYAFFVDRRLWIVALQNNVSYTCLAMRRPAHTGVLTTDDVFPDAG